MTKKPFVLLTITTLFAVVMFAGCNSGESTTGEFAPGAQVEKGPDGKPLAPAPAPATSTK